MRAFAVRTLALVALIVGVASTARADVTYSYTGSQFSQFGGFDTPTCAPLCRITGWFTLDQPLGPDLPLTDIAQAPYHLIAFGFTDGVTTVTSQFTGDVSFKVQTNANGDVSAWDILLTSDISFVFSMFYQASDAQDFSCTGDCSFPLGLMSHFAVASSVPGTWYTDDDSSPGGQQGPAGPAGPKGDTGPEGPQGPAGVTPEQLASMRQQIAALQQEIAALKAALDREHDRDDGKERDRRPR